MPTKPITPRQAAGKKNLPDEVIQAFNELIQQNYSGGYATVAQSDVANLIASKLDITREEVFDKKYLDVEEIFEKAGWSVEYDKPGFNETYEATFNFKKKK